MPVQEIIDKRLASYMSAFEQSEQMGPLWLGEIRRAAIQSFAELGFPTTHDEDWKFTNVAPLARASFHCAAEFDGASRAAGLVRRFPVNGYRLVFINGRYSADLSGSRRNLLPHLVLASLRDALENREIERRLARYADYKKHAFVALNTAFVSDGAFVYVPAGVVVDRPIDLIHVSVAESGPQVSYPRNLIVCGAGSQASIVETYVGVDQYFTNAVTEIAVGEDAIVDHYKLQQESDNAFHIGTLQVEQDRGCVFKSCCVSLGGALTRNQVNSVLAEGSECTLNGLYIAGGRQHVDTHTSIDHAQPHATSRELYKGILDGRSSAVFNGKIIVRKDAQKTDAKQTNKNLVLSEHSTINTKPELQIYADDVRCTHGATVGQLDEEAIFYLRSRGVGLEGAREMLTHAFASEIIDGISLESLRNYVEGLLR